MGVVACIVPWNFPLPIACWKAAPALAAGLTMCLGAMGSIFSGAGVGYLRDTAQGNWSLVFWVLSGLALLPALMMVSLWNARPKGGR